MHFLVGLTQPAIYNKSFLIFVGEQREIKEESK